MRVKRDEHIENGLFIFCKISWNVIKEGTKDISKIFDTSTRSIRNLSIALILCGICFYFMYFTNHTNMIIFSLIGLVLMSGIKNILVFKYQKWKEAKKIISLNKQFDDRFESIGFKDKLGKYPLLVQELENDYFKDFIFYSNIPISTWQSKKLDVEEILNKKIINIQTDHDDTSMKIIKVANLPEPNYVSFSRKYLSELPHEIWLGLNVYSQPVYMNLKTYPNLIVAGGTGGGKSTTAYSIYTQLRRHKQNHIILCDFKKNTFKSLVKWNNNKPCITSKEEFINMLNWAKKENARRLDLFNKFDECENIYEYNKLVGNSEQLKNIYIMIDELAIITSHEKRDSSIINIEDTITHLCQTGRSQGFCLMVFTQRPSTKTVPAEARANFMSRISSFQSDKNTSEMAVGDYTASELPPIEGRMVVKLASKHIECQMAHFKKEKIKYYLEENK